MRGLWVESQDGKNVASVRDIPEDSLPAGEVLVRVEYSSLNYKDGLAVTGKGKVVKGYPWVPGIDLAGVVVESQSPVWKKGDPVVVTGWGVGEKQWGGFAELARVKADWLVRLPEGMTLQDSMVIGTAGFTAMLSLMALEEHGAKKEGLPILVTGAAGGVGTIAVALLARAGFKVIASTGRTELHPLLQSLGATEIIGRDQVGGSSNAPLQSQRFGGAIDVVGGKTLAQILPQLAQGASLAACGLAGGSSFETTVFPFILRAVNLLGIESAYCPRDRREQAWNRLRRELPKEVMAKIAHVAPLEEVPRLSEEILQGKVQGRTVVAVSAKS
ncbi:MAG TPA: MDR family oxidoreductase [Myxococcaceae bacterium]|nr:MDR family oxidoreductase [Myxococcaceae bacterium]